MNYSSGMSDMLDAERQLVTALEQLDNDYHQLTVEKGVLQSSQRDGRSGGTFGKVLMMRRAAV
jgi:hypothetical protein